MMRGIKRKVIAPLLLAIVCTGCFLHRKQQYVMLERFGGPDISEGWTQEMFDSAGIKDISKTAMPFYLRLYGGSYALDVWSGDEVTYHGSITYYIHNEGKDKVRYFARSYPVSDSAAGYVAGLYRGKKLASLPDGRDPLTAQMVDGHFWTFDCLEHGNYTRKVYRTPASRELSAVDDFCSHVDTAIARAMFGNFIDLLPDGVYRNGATSIVKYPYN